MAVFAIFYLLVFEHYAKSGDIRAASRFCFLITLRTAGETDNINVLKDSSMLKRLNDITSFSQEEQKHILFALDAMITKVKLGNI